MTPSAPRTRSPRIPRPALAAGLFLLAVPAAAQPLFADSFDNTPSPLWSNQRGAWTVSGGEYFATAPANLPPTVTLLPFVLGDFDLEVDVRAVSDGGVWIHADAEVDNAVLLVTGGDLRTGRGFYWHTIRDGVASGFLNRTGDLFRQGDDIHIRLSARGDTYAVYLNGSPSPASTLSAPGFPHGFVGLYDFADPAQRFDNLALSVPCAADFNRDGFVDFFDYDGFVAAFESGQDSADFNNDGFVDFFDYDGFVGAFESGC